MLTNGTLYVKIGYDVVSSVGSWDFILWGGNLANPTFLYSITSYFERSTQIRDEEWAIWENDYAKLMVYPNLSFKDPDNYHYQYAYLTSKLNNGITFNYSFMFSEQLVSGMMEYRISSVVNGVLVYDWIDITDSIEYIEKNGKYYYYQLDRSINANQTIVVRFKYKTQSQTGKWDLILESGATRYELDPYWGVGDYSGDSGSLYGAFIDRPTDGFYYEGRIDWKTLKKHWNEDNLTLCVPFYDSYIFNNLLTGKVCYPDIFTTEEVGPSGTTIS